MRETAQRCYELLRSGYAPDSLDGYPKYDNRIRDLVTAIHKDEIFDMDYMKHFELIKDK